MDPHVYLDWNATTPIHPDVIAEMTQTAAEIWGNASSVHFYGRLARERIEQARSRIARHFGAHPRDVMFVSGGTEANNAALLDAPALVTSQLEHPSVTQVARELERRGRPVRWLRVDRSGQIDLDSLSQCVEGLPEGAIVAVQAVNHETGVIQPLAAVAEVTARCSAWLHVDAVQAVGSVAAEVFSFGDSFTIAAHKLQGPKAIGALIWRCGRRTPHPLMFGGSQQRGLRPGTPDPVATAGFEAAFVRAIRHMECRESLGVLRDRLELQLRGIAESNVSAAPRVEHVSSLYVPGWRGDELVAALDIEGVCVSSGSACSAGTAEPSPVILSMWNVERASGTIRISLGETTSEADVERAVATIRRVTARATPQKTARG